MYQLTYLGLSFIIIQITLTADLHPRVYDSINLQANVDQYLVQLVLHELKSAGTCSGSILSKRWIISAAHCFEGNVLDVKVQKRLYKRVQTDVVPFQKVIAEVNKSGIRVHPDYVQGLNTFKNTEQDLALLKTTKNILMFGYFSKPIRLASFRPKIGHAAILAGYGNSEHGTTIPRMGDVMLSKCEKSDRNTKLLCSHSTVRAGPGDSGGPLITKNRLVGVISSGCEDVQIHQDCETYYVNITQHLDWIKKISGIK